MISNQPSLCEANTATSPLSERCVVCCHGLGLLSLFSLPLLLHPNRLSSPPRPPSPVVSMDPWRPAPYRVSSSALVLQKQRVKGALDLRLDGSTGFIPSDQNLVVNWCYVFIWCELMVCVYVNWCCVLMYELMVLCVDVWIFNDVLLYELMFPFGMNWFMAMYVSYSAVCLTISVQCWFRFVFNHISAVCSTIYKSCVHSGIFTNVHTCLVFIQRGCLYSQTWADNEHWWCRSTETCISKNLSGCIHHQFVSSQQKRPYISLQQNNRIDQPVPPIHEFITGSQSTTSTCVHDTTTPWV
jgi:hypothetical protein